MKRISSFLLAVVMMLSAFGGVSIVQAADQKAGDNITWSLSGNVLTFSGTGDMYDYGPGNFPEWMASSTAQEIVISSGITSIGDYAFNSLIRVTSVTIPNTVKSIGKRAFSGCYMLKSIAIPASVTEIGSCAFSTATGGMSNLEEITVAGGNAYFTVENGILYNSAKTILYKVPSKLQTDVLNVMQGVITINEEAMINCTNLTEINLPDSVKAVGNNAFSACKNLTTVVVNNRDCSLGLGSVPDNEGLKLYGYQGTNTELYVKNNGCANVEFVPLDNQHIHIWDDGVVTKAATTSATGVITYTCTGCGETETETIAKIASAALNTTSTGYTGKEITPTITVKDSAGKTLVNGTDYTVTMDAGRINVGRYAVKITYKGNYSGTQTLYFNIIPKGTNISSVSVKTNGFTVQWATQKTQTTGYQVQYSKNSNFTSATTINMPKPDYYAKAVSGLAKNTKYYVRVRTYTVTKFNGANYTIYSPWSSAKTAYTVTTTATLSTTATYYTGTVKTPGVTVKDSTGRVLKNGTDYTVTQASGRKNVGRYAVKITYKGTYEGVPAQTLYFNIIPRGITGITKVTASSKGFTVQWNTQKTATTGYQVQYSTSSNFANAKTITMPKNTYYAKKVTGLASNKKYYVRVRTYTTTKFNGKNYNIYSPWCAVKTVTTKK